jgi:hypothetical protein
MNVFKLLKYLLVDAFTLYGGGKGGGSAPSYPDPTKVAQATTQTNTDTAAYNKALNLNNFSNPFGSQQTTQVGTDPKTGAPIYNTNTQATSTVSDLLGHNLAQADNSTGVQQNALNGLGGLGSYLSSLGQQAQGVGNNFGSYQQGALGLSPQYQGISNNIGNVAGNYSGISNNVGNAAAGYNGLMGNVGNAASGYNNLIGNTGALAGQYNNLNSQYAALGSQLDQGAAKAAQQQGQDAAYKAQTQYLDPQFSQQNESLGAQLANQGLAPGSQAYNNAMTNFNNTKQQAYSNAQNQAIMTGSQLGAQNLQNQISGINTQSGLLGAQGQNLGAQAGLYGQQAGMLGNQINAYGQQAGMLGNQIGAYGQQAGVLGNQANAYGQQMNALGGQAGLYGLAGQLGQGQLGALGTGMTSAGQQAGLYGQQVGIGQLPYQNAQSVAGFIPGYTGTGQSSSAPADIAGLYNNQYQSQLAGYNAGQSSSNNMMSGLFGLGSAGIMGMMMSDRRAKRSIKRVATWANGLGVYTYRYMWEPKGVRHLGFMADEVRKVAPHAVRRGDDGFDRVNYQLAA